MSSRLPLPPHTRSRRRGIRSRKHAPGLRHASEFDGEQETSPACHTYHIDNRNTHFRPPSKPGYFSPSAPCENKPRQRLALQQTNVSTYEIANRGGKGGKEKEKSMSFFLTASEGTCCDSGTCCDTSRASANKHRRFVSPVGKNPSGWLASVQCWRTCLHHPESRR